MQEPPTFTIATKNNAEFLSVTSEYFFERPDQFEAEHPELFRALKIMFRQPLPIK
jgi:Mlc titration factor MtfA (ptsG expression regulator)